VMHEPRVHAGDRRLQLLQARQQASQTKV